VIGGGGWWVMSGGQWVILIAGEQSSPAFLAHPQPTTHNPPRTPTTYHLPRLPFKAAYQPQTFPKIEFISMAIPATQIRRGMVIVFEGDPVRVIEFRHHTPGNLRAMVQAKLKNLRSGSSFEHRFRAADSIEPASMETHELEYMYDAGGTYHFMNTENYDQLEMDEETLGDYAPWMQPGMKIQAEYYDGRPVGIRLPNSMTLEIVETAPVMKTATKTASTKPAKLENGVTIQVPEFIGTGDKVRVNPSTGEYQERAK